MKIYLAPLEGITGWIYRGALRECFGGFDKYFVPFIRPNQKGHLSSREKNDISPANNQGAYTVPQILTNNAEDFLRTAEKLEEYGYSEVNLNLGCPSKTVVTKGRGAGFLAYPERLETFLDTVFRECRIRISVKTRIGIEDGGEFKDLLQMFNSYPMEELIIHPRVQKDFYKNVPNLEVFGEALSESRNPVCYNGDLFSAEDYHRFHEMFPDVECIMLGRGVLSNPALAREIRGGKSADLTELRRFHDLVYAGYCREMSGDRTILYKMKEMWSYMAPLLEDHKKYGKKIKKCEKCAVYEDVIDEFFEKQQGGEKI